MSKAQVLLPTRADVCGWDDVQRATVARLLYECTEPPLTAHRSPRRRKLVLTLGAGGAVVMLPWLVFLSMTLPAQSPAGAWRTAWIGFDVALALVLASTALTVWGRRQLAPFAMVITASLLTCDAWFDLCLSWGSAEHWSSVASAAIELPVAVLLASSAATVLRRDATVVARLRGQDPVPTALWRRPMIHLSAECHAAPSGVTDVGNEVAGPSRSR